MLAFGYTIVSLVYSHCFHGTEPENVKIRCCLDEWRDGTQKHVPLDSRVYDRIYDGILADIQAAEQIQHLNEKLLETRTAWWDKAVYAAFLDLQSKFPDQRSKVISFESTLPSTPVTENIFLPHRDSHQRTYHAP